MAHQPERHILEHREIVEQRSVLEHDAEPQSQRQLLTLTQRHDIDALDAHLTRGGLQ
jgi:hypothetical protein